MTCLLEFQEKNDSFLLHSRILFVTVYAQHRFDLNPEIYSRIPQTFFENIEDLRFVLFAYIES